MSQDIGLRAGASVSQATGLPAGVTPGRSQSLRPPTCVAVLVQALCFVQQTGGPALYSVSPAFTLQCSYAPWRRRGSRSPARATACHRVPHVGRHVLARRGHVRKDCITSPHSRRAGGRCHGYHSEWPPRAPVSGHVRRRPRVRSRRPQVSCASLQPMLISVQHSRRSG